MSKTVEERAEDIQKCLSELRVAIAPIIGKHSIADVDLMSIFALLAGETVALSESQGIPHMFAMDTVYQNVLLGRYLKSSTLLAPPGTKVN